MNNIKSLEEFVAVVTNIFTTLHERGDLTTPVPSPQPWSLSSYNPKYEGERDHPARRAPWSFGCYVVYQYPDQNRSVLRFEGVRLTAHVPDRTMEGKHNTITVRTVEDIPAAIEKLDAFRREALNRCRHTNHIHVANLGRCYNRYRCVDCGVEFNIDSGD